MKSPSTLGFRRLALVALVGLLLTPTLAVAQTFNAQPLQGTLGPDRDTYGTAKVPPVRGAIETADGRVRVLVELVDRPLALYSGNLLGLKATRPSDTGARRLDVKSAASLAYRGYLADRQQSFLKELSLVAPGASVLGRYDVVFNGLSVAVDRASLKALEAMPGVAKVFPDRMNYQTLDASLPLIQASALWNQLGGRDHAGAGIKVAVVDGGIRPENPMFAGTGFSYPPGYPLSDDYCGTVDPGFCTGKLIVARSFRTVALHPLEHDNPLGYNGHGTHVAGIAVGNYVAGATASDGVPENISGVAPGAWLMVYKALWWNGTTGSGSTTDLIAALNAAVADGADVINNSWGGSGGADPATDAFGPVFDAIKAAGVVAVVAAGNAGPGAMSIACPGCQQSVITAANTTTNRIHALGCSIVGGPSAGCLEGTGPALTASLGPLPIVYAGDVGDPLGCSAFPAGSLTGAIALIQRGTCNFSVKVSNAEAAGALFVKMFNNVPGAPIIMGSLESTGISSCMVSQDAGQDILTYIQAHPGSQAQVTYPASRQTDDAWQDFVNSTSSRGPDGDPDVLKPDVAAPGTRILSAYSPEQAGDFAFLSGTSMASPHVAGSAALLLAKHPSWTPDEVKTALTSTAHASGLLKEDGVTPADPFDVGAGRLDLKQASRAGVTFDQPSMADSTCFQGCSFTRTIHGETGLPGTWIATVQKDDGTLGVKVSPPIVFLPPGGSASFDVDVDTTLVQQGQWHFARVVWKRLLGGSADAGLPIAVFATASTNDALLTKTVDQSVASPHDVLTYDIDLTNLALTGPIDLEDAVPDNATYVPGSASALVDGLPDPGFTYDAGSDRLTWSGMLDPATLQLTPSPSPFGYVPLNLFVAPLGCSSVCDDTSITLTGVPAFQYLGASYNSLVMSTNGFAVVGSDNTNAYSPFNQMLPDPAPPNNVLAPFWTDFDLDGTDPADSGAGTWYAAILSAGSQTFTVLEWQGAELYGVPGFPFTFQIWIEAGTPNIWFVYAAIPGIPSALTTGVEESQGLIGSSTYFDGGGTPPAVGTDLAVDASPGGTAHFTYQAEVGCKTDPVVNVAEVTSGATTARAFAATAVEPDGLALCVSGSCPGLVQITGSGAGLLHVIQFWKADGSGTSTIHHGACSGTQLDLQHPSLFPAIAIAGADGSFQTLSLALGGSCGDLLQAVDLAECTTSNTATLP